MNAETVNTSGKGKSFIVPFCSSFEIGLGSISEKFRRIMATKQRKQIQQQQPTKTPQSRDLAILCSVPAVRDHFLI